MGLIFLTMYVLRFMGLSDDNLFNALLYSIGIILIILIMLGSVFLIYNSFTISLNRPHTPVRNTYVRGSHRKTAEEVGAV